jgi:hypothetical protein
MQYLGASLKVAERAAAWLRSTRRARRCQFLGHPSHNNYITWPKSKRSINHLDSHAQALCRSNLHPLGIARHYELQSSHDHFGAADTVPVHSTHLCQSQCPATCHTIPPLATLSFFPRIDCTCRAAMIIP